MRVLIFVLLAAISYAQTAETTGTDVVVNPDAEAPETPETVETPETPETVETPETPEVVTPEAPETPETPEAPETPSEGEIEITEGGTGGTGSGGSGDSGSGGSGGSGGGVVVDYNPCYGRKCGMICNNCQLGEMCADTVHRCNGIGQCVPDSFTCEATITRHPLQRVSCVQQSRAGCYGLSSDLTAEYDGVCGWSTQLGRCVVVSIGEEVESATCLFHKTILACNGGATNSFGGVPMPAEGEPGEGVDIVCAWNPFTNTCKDGQLENEAGDGMGFGIPTYSVCNTYGTSPQTCPAPYCSWTGTACVPGIPPNLQKTNAATKTNTWILAGMSAGAFVVGLMGSWVVVKMCRKTSKLSEPLHLGPV